VTNIFVTEPPPGIGVPIPLVGLRPPTYDEIGAIGGDQESSTRRSGYEPLANIYNELGEMPPLPPEKDDTPPASPAPEKLETEPKPMLTGKARISADNNDYLKVSSRQSSPN